MAQELNNNLEGLKEYAKEIREVYAAVATKIEELVELLNTTNTESSKVIQTLTARILKFLGEIKSFVKKEKITARSKNWLDSNKNEFLALIQKELKDVNLLIKSLKIEQKHPKNQLVAIIYSLNKEIKRIMAAEEAVLSK